VDKLAADPLGLDGADYVIVPAVFIVIGSVMRRMWALLMS
jgi:hypothetical protein